MTETRFTAPLYTADIGRIEKDRPIRVILRSFAYGIDDENDPDRIYVPVGFCSDGTSVPTLFRGLVPVWGRYAQAAIIHDLLYATNAMEREAADTLFRDAILVLGRDQETDTPPMRCKLLAFLAFWAVRLFGESAYLNGRFNYPALADRAHKRASEKDADLAPTIIRTLDGLAEERVMRGEAEEAILDEA